MDDVFNLNFDLSRIITSGVTALAIALVAWLLARYARRVISIATEHRMQRLTSMSDVERKQRGDTVAGTLGRVASLAIWVLAGVIIMAEFGINVGPIIAGLGVGAIALGFAAQNILRDYMHGFLIVTEDWYRVGEVASIAGTAGLVTAINLRTTVMRDLDGTVHIIPNGQVTTASNLTREFGRINLNVEVAYGENLDRVIAVINDECEKMKAEEEWGEQLLATPKVLRVDNLGSSGIEIKVVGDTKPMSRWDATGELRKRLKARFDTEGIEIPWPHTKVYFGNGMPEVEERVKETA
jgi:small conductance mechanosensitive channel